MIKVRRKQMVLGKVGHSSDSHRSDSDNICSTRRKVVLNVSPTVAIMNNKYAEHDTMQCNMMESHQPTQFRIQ